LRWFGRPALHLPRRGSQRRDRVPRGARFFCLLSPRGPPALERALLGWPDPVSGKLLPEDDSVAPDGREWLNHPGMNIVGADAVQSGHWPGSEPIAKGSKKIPTARA